MSQAGLEANVQSGESKASSLLGWSRPRDAERRLPPCKSRVERGSFVYKPFLSVSAEVFSIFKDFLLVYVLIKLAY